MGLSPTLAIFTDNKLAETEDVQKNILQLGNSSKVAQAMWKAQKFQDMLKTLDDVPLQVKAAIAGLDETIRHAKCYIGTEFALKKLPLLRVVKGKVARGKQATEVTQMLSKTGLYSSLEDSVKKIFRSMTTEECEFVISFRVQDTLCL